MLTAVKRIGLGLALVLCAAQCFAATVYITEYKPGPSVVYASSAPQTPAVASQTVAIGGSSAQSAAFNSQTVLIRVVADATCSILIGGINPVATSGDARFAAGVPEYFIVKPGDKLAVITNS